jgi:peptidoglycan/xylan/chitin deacetylase (PgdA/CDA1 family)
MSILCYHAVDPAWESRLSVPPKLFGQHCAWLARNRKVVPLEEAASAAGPYGSLSGGRSAITFDDGFTSVYEHAWPVLKRHRLPATVFLVAKTLTGEGLEVTWAEGPPDRRLTTLSVDQVREMQADGIVFGSHSHAHKDLVDLTEAECETDLRSSRELLEDVLQKEVRMLAYPRGLHNERVHRAAEKAGFTYAFGTSKPTEERGPLAIPRIGVYPDNGTAGLRLKTSRLYPRLRTGGLWPGSRAQTH